MIRPGPSHLGQVRNIHLDQRGSPNDGYPKQAYLKQIVSLDISWGSNFVQANRNHRYGIYGGYTRFFRWIGTKIGWLI